MSLRNEQCRKVCRIIDDALANRPAERDSLIIAVQIAFEALERVYSSSPNCSETPNGWIPCTPETMPEEAGTYLCTCADAGRLIVTLIKWQPRMKSWNLTGARTYWKVIAWCESPAPFRTKEDES